MADNIESRWRLLLKYVGDNLRTTDIKQILFVVDIPEGTKEELIKADDGTKTLKALLDYDVINMENPGLLIKLLDVIEKRHLIGCVKEFMDRELNRKSIESQRKQKELHMTASPRGICLIISNEKFAPSHSINGGTLNVGASDNCNSGGSLRSNSEYDRPGTCEDEKAFAKTFAELGFEVKIKRNCRGGEMLNALERIAYDDHAEYDAFICCILSHGYNNGGDNIVLGTDWKAESVTDLKEKLTGTMCRSLSEKPKIFLVQACSNEDLRNVAEKLSPKAIESDDRERSRMPDSEKNGKSDCSMAECNSSKTDAESEHQTFDEVPSGAQIPLGPVADQSRNGSVLPAVADFLSYISAIPETGKEKSSFVSIVCDVFNNNARNEDLMLMLNSISKRIVMDGHPTPRLTKNLSHYKVYF